MTSARNWILGLVSGALVAGTATSAAADGMRRGSLKDAPLPVAPYSWTGAYIGVNAGYSWGEADTDTSATTTTRTRVFRTAGQNLVSDVTTTGNPTFIGGTADIDGWLGGVQLGYNWQSGSWVVGLETDFQWTGEEGSVTGCSPSCAVGNSFVTARTELDWFGTLRARAGYLISPTVLVYATGGLAYGHLDTSYSTGLVGAAATGFFGDSKTKAGWVVGGGIEGAVDKKWLLRAEYLYMDLGEIANSSQTSSTSTNTLNTPQAGFNTVVDTTTVGNARTKFIDHIFRIGLSYKLN